MLRRPPRPPLPPSAHDVVREARLQLALAPLGIRVPRIRAVCEDVPCSGCRFTSWTTSKASSSRRAAPRAGWRRRRPSPAGRRPDRHSGRDPCGRCVRTGPGALVRPGSYLERQVRRFSQLWEVNATRPLPLVGEVGASWRATIRSPQAPVVVHGDYRLGNMIVAQAVTGPSSPCSTGRWALSATREQMSVICSPRTRRRVASRALSALLR